MAGTDAPIAREHRFSARDGLRLFWREYGDPLSDETPLLCLPGLTRNGKDFTAFAARHAPRRRVLCPDYRGRGQSGHAADWRSYSPETCLDDLMQLMAVADVHRCAVVGASFGGLLGVGLAVAMPSALAALVMNDIGPEIETPTYARLIEVIGRDRPLASWDEAVPALRAMFPNLVFQDERSWEAAARNTWREGDDGRLHADWDPALTRPLKRAPPPAPLWGLFRAVRRIPVLALRGEHSDMLSVACFDRMAAEKPDIARVTIAGAGHTPTLDEPDARAALDDFLARV